MNVKESIDYSRWLTIEGLEAIQGWRQRGLSLEEVAKNMKMSLSSLLAFRKREPLIDDILKKDGDFANANVENALYKRACGFSKFIVKQKLTKDGEIVELKEEQYYPPSEQAQIFWLTNKLSNVWQNRKTQETRLNIEDDGLADAITKSARTFYSDSSNFKNIVDE